MKYIVKIALGILLVIISLFVSRDLKPEFVGGGMIILISLLILDMPFDLYNNWERIKLVLHIKFLSLKGEKIRFSMSYLYRIKVDNKYLLVKNQNFGHYQLVGGKYKRHNEAFHLLKNEFEAIDDLKLKNSGIMRDDFALFIPAKNAVKFIDWFNKGKDREISHWREFYEELIEGKGSILSKENFPYINYNYVGRVITPIKRTPGWNAYEILQFDILDLIPNEKQLEELSNVLNKGDNDYIKWADYELINNLGHDNRKMEQLYKIGEHTKWALNMKWSKD